MGDNRSSDEHTKIAAMEILKRHKQKVEEKTNALVSCMHDLKEINHAAWHREGQELVRWMNTEADYMAKVENNVAITKVTGGSTAILGGVLTGVGVVASFFTFGLAAPMAVAGGVLAASGGATAAGGGIAQMSIVHVKTHDIQKRCECFTQSMERVLSLLVEIRLAMEELSRLCKQAYPKEDESAILEIILGIAKAGVVLGWKTVNVCRMVVKLAAESVISTGLRACLKGSVAVAGSIGFGIWDVADGAGTLQNGGSNAALIRNNAQQIATTVNDIVDALRTLEVYK